MNTTLLIMAAGLGSRFGGGIKQLEPVGMHDEIIMDYSIHDAIQAGFNKVVFVIRKDIEEDFKERIGKRIEPICNNLGVKVEYVFQNPCDIPGDFPEGRKKPWGTGQALLAAKDVIHEPFMVINADDYYGKTAFGEMHDWLEEDHSDHAIAMAGFILKNTLSDHGGVTRGICTVEDGHTHVVDVKETRDIIKTVDSKTGEIGAMADGRILDPNSYVSMNFWGFPAKEGQDPEIMSVLQNGFKEFFKEEVPKAPFTAEYLLPDVIGKLLREGKVTVKVLETPDKWFGVTYKEDKPKVVEDFKKLIQEGMYPENLYSDLKK